MPFFSQSLSNILQKDDEAFLIAKEPAIIIVILTIIMSNEMNKVAKDSKEYLAGTYLEVGTNGWIY